MTILGLRTSADFAPDGARPKNWREGILMLYPNSAEARKAPLTALTSRMKERMVDDPEFNWFEKMLDDRRLRLDASTGDLDTSSGAQTLNLDNTTDPKHTAIKCVEGMILMVEQTGEQLRVASDPVQGDKITVTRGWAGTTPTALDPDDAGKNPYLLIIGSAYEENSKAPTGVNFGS